MEKKMKRLCTARSRRAVFTKIFAAAVLGFLILNYYTNYMGSTATSTFDNYADLSDNGHLDYFKYFWTNNDNNFMTENNSERYDSVLASRIMTISQSIQDQQLNVITDNSSLVTNTAGKFHEQTTTKVNKSTCISREVYYKTTTMTFDDTLITYCKESPIVQCPSPPRVRVTTDKTFQISYLRQPTWLLENKHLDVSLCEYNQCRIDDSPVTNETDAVVVYGVGLRDSFLPPQRWKHQVLIIAMWESPVYTNADFLRNQSSVWNSQINLIMSYRVDADIFVPYGKLKFSPKPLDQRPDYYDIAKRKTRTAIWIVSHCRTQSKRGLYVKNMQKYIDVTIAGHCGKRCSKKNSCDDLSKYKFYLAFENSLCTDYVTEKFFKLFVPEMHVIPVVRGWVDYDRYLPDFTYINADHFKKPKDLALHLKKVSL